MKIKVRDVTVEYEDIGSGTPLLVLHSWFANGRTEMPEYEPLFERRRGWRRIYPDVAAAATPPLPAWMRGPDQVVDLLLEFMDTIAPGEPFAITGSSWGAYLAAAIVQRRVTQVVGVLFSVPALEYPASVREVLARQVIRHDPAFDAALQPDEEWLRDYFVVQDLAALELSRNWPFPPPYSADVLAFWGDKAFSFDPTVMPETCRAPALFLAGRQDQIVGYRKVMSMLDHFPRATLAVLDRAGHLLEAEQPTLRTALVNEWLGRVEEYTTHNPRT